MDAVALETLLSSVELNSQLLGATVFCTAMVFGALLAWLVRFW